MVMKTNIIMAADQMEFIFHAIEIILVINEIIYVALVTRVAAAGKVGIAKLQKCKLVVHLKMRLTEPGNWTMGMGGFGEMLA